MKNLKQRLQNGEAVHGCWLSLGNALTAEMVAMAGFDWVLADLEHGAGSEQDALAQFQAVAHTQAAALVRVESHAPKRILRVLDMGAAGVMCPQISNVAEAKAMVDAIRYPPQGSRGIAKFVRGGGFGADFADYFATANENILGIAQVESAEGLQNVEQIAAVDGIDVLFIGPSDLSAALGVFGQFESRTYIGAVDKITAAAKKAGKAVGILLPQADDYQRYYDWGVRMIACGADGAFVAEGARSLSQKMNGLRAGNQS